MRILWLLSLVLLAAGCASSQRARPLSHLPPIYDDAVATALTFDPPITFGQPPLLLAREPRQPAAFVGFDEVSTSIYWIRTDDRQSDTEPDQYRRRAVIEKAGVSYR